MPISDYFPFAIIRCCDDDGVYYMRQLERSTDFSFEGMVWYGQKLQSEPEWANVFIGRLIKNAGIDAAGNNIDRWEGYFFDVPKGKNCGHGLLSIESIVIKNPTRAGCDFPEFYIRKINGPAFGGTFWGMEDTISGCAHGLTDIPPIPPLLRRALSGDSSSGRLNIVMDDIAALGSANVNNGFTTTEVNNLSGIYRCDDGGKYYLRHLPGTDDVVWYGESANARPVDPSTSPYTPASGFANVFWGKKSGGTIIGLWADVPRGATQGNGQMTLSTPTPGRLNITSATGGFGGRIFRKIVSMETAITAQSLTIVNANESGDEPLIYLVFYKIDGETIDFERLSSGHATFQTPPSILVGDNLQPDIDHRINPAYNIFKTSLELMPSVTADTRTQTKIGIIGFAHEVDEGSSNEFRRNRFLGWRNSQMEFLNNQLSNGVIPTNDAIQTNAQRILVQYLGPWEGWPWGDPDDVFSGDAAQFSYQELENALRSGVSTLNTELNFRSARGHYRLNVSIDISQHLCG